MVLLHHSHTIGTKPPLVSCRPGDNRLDCMNKSQHTHYHALQEDSSFALQGQNNNAAVITFFVALTISKASARELQTSFISAESWWRLCDLGQNLANNICFCSMTIFKSKIPFFWASTSTHYHQSLFVFPVSPSAGLKRSPPNGGHLEWPWTLCCILMGHDFQLLNKQRGDFHCIILSANKKGSQFGGGLIRLFRLETR